LDEQSKLSYPERTRKITALSKVSRVHQIHQGKSKYRRGRDTKWTLSPRLVSLRLDPRGLKERGVLKKSHGTGG